MEETTILHPKEDEAVLLPEETDLEERLSIKDAGTGTLNQDVNRIWFNVTQPREVHCRREKEMEALQNYWTECINNPTILLFVEITGIAGTGKTEFVSKFVSKFHDENKGHCIWIDGQNIKSISHSFRKLAIEQEISLKDSLGREKPFHFLLRDVYKKLFNSECIIIFDNFEGHDQSVLITLIEFADKQPLLDVKPLVLLISRNGVPKTFPQLETKEIQVNFFPPELVTAFVIGKMNISEKDGKCIALCEILGEKLQYSPLAMAQAVAYLAMRNKSLGTEKKIQKYLNALEEETNNMPDDFKELDDHFKAAYLTLEVSLKKIANLPVVGSRVRMAMKMLSFFAPETAININFAMGLLRSLPTSNDNIKSAIRSSISLRNEISIFKSLHDYQLCQGVSTGKNNFILIQRNVQEIIRAGLEKEEESMDILHILLEMIGKSLTKGEIPMNQMAHVENVWRYAVDNRELVKSHAHLPRKIVSKYFNEGMILEAFDFSCGAAKALEDAIGEENRLTLNMKYWKGVVYKERKEFKDALELLEEVYEKQRCTFGAEHHDCLLTAREIGVVLSKQRKFEEAMILLEDTKQTRERVSGAEHRETLKLIGDLACLYYDQKKHEEAVNVYEKLEEVEERIFGAEDRRTLSTKHNIATVKFHQGQYSDALPIFHKVLQSKERILEVDHPDVLETKLWLAVTYKCLGRHEDGLNLARETHDCRLKILGTEDTLTISAKELIVELETLMKRSS